MDQNTQKRQDAAKALAAARTDLLAAYNRMHNARTRLEELEPVESEVFLRHQSDSGALWALASQIHEMRKTINQIIKAVTPEESTK